MAFIPLQNKRGTTPCGKVGNWVALSLRKNHKMGGANHKMGGASQFQRGRQQWQFRHDVEQHLIEWQPHRRVCTVELLHSERQLHQVLDKQFLQLRRFDVEIDLPKTIDKTAVDFSRRIEVVELGLLFHGWLMAFLKSGDRGDERGNGIGKGLGFQARHRRR